MMHSGGPLPHPIITAREVAGIVPAAPPPPGVVPSFNHPESNAQPVIISSLACLAVATLSLCMRLYARAIIIRRFDPTDYAFVSSWVCSCVLSAISVATCFEGGLGNHIWDMSLAKFTTFLKLKTCTSVFYCLGIMFVKLSLLLFYLQVSPMPKFRLAVYSLIFVVVGYSIASVFVVIFSCFPVAKSWDVTITTGFCLNLPVFYITNLSLNSATDIAVLILPIPMLWNVRMPMREKIAVAGILMTGSGVCAVSIIRIRALVILLNKYDVTWELVEGYIWSSIELNTAILCAALIFVKPLLRKLFPRLLASTVGPTSESRRRCSDPGFNRINTKGSGDRQGWRAKKVLTSTTGNDTMMPASESQEEIIELR